MSSTRVLKFAIYACVVLAAWGMWSLRELIASPASFRNAPKRSTEHRGSAMLRAHFDATSQSLERLRTGTPATNRVPAILEFLQRIAEDDPELAIELSVGLKAAEGRDQALHECLRLWLASDPKAAREWLLAAQESQPDEVLAVLGRESAAFDAALALELVSELQVDVRRAAMQHIMGEWAALDPKAAADAAEALPVGGDRALASAEVARAWVDREPRAAYDWASRATDPVTRRTALETVLPAWSRVDPEAAGKAVLALPSDPTRRRLVDGVSREWAGKAPDEALRWVATLPDASERDAANVTVLSSLSQQEPERALDSALSLGGSLDSPVLEKTLTAVVARNPALAMSWANGVPDATARRELVSAVLERWRAQNPQGAEHWAMAHRGSLR